MVFGEFDDSLLGSLVQIMSGSLRYTQIPYAASNVVDIAAPLDGFSGLAVMDGISLDGGNDILFATNGDGAYRIEQFASLANIFVPTLFSGSDAWAGARHLTVAPRATAGPEALWGVVYHEGAGGAVTTEILIGEVNGVALTTTSLITLPSFLSVYGISVYDHDGDGNNDVFLATNYGLVGYSQDLGQGPKVLRRHIVLATGGGCTSFLSTELVAGVQTSVARMAYWFVEPGSKFAKLAVIQGKLTEPIQNIVAFGGDPTVGTLPMMGAPGDPKGDGNQGLLLKMDGGYCLYLANLADAGAVAPARHFGVGQSEFLVLGALGPASEPASDGTALFANIDSEPGDDVTFSIASTCERSVYTRFGPTQTDNGGVVHAGASVTDVISSESCYTPETATSDPRFNLVLNIPEGAIGPQSREFTHLEVVLFHQAGPAQGRITTREATQRFLHPLVLATPVELHQWVSAVPRDPTGAAIVDPNPFVNQTPIWPNEDHVWVTFRFVKIPLSPSNSTTYLNASKLYTTTLILYRAPLGAGGVTPGDMTVLDYALGLSPETYQGLNFCSEPGGTDGAYIAYHVPMIIVPPLPPAETYRFGPKELAGSTQVYQTP